MIFPVDCGEITRACFWHFKRTANALVAHDRKTQHAAISQKVIIIAIAAHDIATLTHVGLHSTRLREPAADDTNLLFILAVGLSHENVQTGSSDESAAERGAANAESITQRRSYEAHAAVYRDAKNARYASTRPLD